MLMMIRRPEFLMMRRPEFLMCAALRHPAPPYKRGPNGTYYTTHVFVTLSSDDNFSKGPHRPDAIRQRDFSLDQSHFPKFVFHFARTNCFKVENRLYTSHYKFKPLLSKNIVIVVVIKLIVHKPMQKMQK
jgi:hypothetical protein